jgi:Kdo2-lipid IVA lauroyltransferase/acyltransferase
MIFYRSLAWLPFPLIYLLAWLGYLLVYYLIGYRKKVVMQNLRNAFPEKSEREVTVLAKKFYRQLTQVILEIIKAQRMSAEDFRRRVRLVNPELIEQHTKGGQQSIILLTIHQGNWEWLLHGVTCGLNMPLDPVYKPLHNKAADKLIYDIRSQFGARPLTMAESTKDILRRRKEFRVFAMVADQSPIRTERSHWTEFMNQPAAFYMGTEAIAKMTGFPVIFGQCRRLRNGYYELEFHEVATPPYDKKSQHITDSYVHRAEQAILAQPESWLWSNRRWKRDPVAERARELAETANSQDAS